MLDVLNVIFVICVGVHSFELHYVPQRHREHAFSSGIPYRESLTWVVKLNFSFSDEKDGFIDADAFAADTGLLYQGQIGSLDRYYVFSHPAGVDVKRSSFSSSTFQDALLTLSQDEQRLIKDKVHYVLDHHPFVEWYMLQRIVPRFRRTAPLMPNYRKLLSVPSSNYDVNFNDPLYHKQWHLVRIN